VADCPLCGEKLSTSVVDATFGACATCRDSIPPGELLPAVREARARRREEARLASIEATRSRGGTIDRSPRTHPVLDKVYGWVGVGIFLFGLGVVAIIGFALLDASCQASSNCPPHAQQEGFC
jgi:hypothetical protein